MIDIDMVVAPPMAAALGFAYGMGPCLISCAPFLAPVFLASDGGVRRSWRVILPLSLGRLLAYAGFGLMAGSLGYFAKGAASSPAVHAVIGCAALMMGTALLLRKPPGTCASVAANNDGFSLHRKDRVRTPRGLLPGGLFLMGVAMALTPCAPLGVVLFSAAMSGGWAEGALLGLSFGLGAIIIPAIFYGVGLSYVGTRLREQLRGWRPRIERLSAILLVAVGIGNLARW